jgi:uncharacterized protein YecE (DUF72 family)
MPGVRVGTCSWKYPSWAGLVYSRAAGVDYLAEYARRWRTVEIDQWFWALPEPATASEYAAAVPADFRFTVKLPNALSLTHLYRRKGETELRSNPQFLSSSLFADVLDRLSPLAGKVGVLMLQFEYLNRQKMGSRDEFLARLGGFLDAVSAARLGGDALFAAHGGDPHGPSLGVELRNPNWLDTAWFEFLARRGVSSVFLQGYYMPPVTALYEKVGSRLRGSTVVRLHGPDREGMEKASGERWDRIIAAKDAELPGIAAMIRDMADHGLTVFLNVNNHYEGSAPLTIERLSSLGIR